MNKTIGNIKNLNVAKILYPTDRGELTLAALLRSLGGQPPVLVDFQRSLDAVEQARSLKQTPIVGVCGTVNSGKSTVVAGFLSEDGRRRVLVGLLGIEGTNRFVFWLPLSWRDNGLGDTVQTMIANVTGKTPELLAESKEEAAKQYNSAENRAQNFYIPLVAYDAALDKSGIAFLDCPDIQSSLNNSSGKPTAHLRLECLEKIAPLCSAFVVVASMEQLRTEVVGKVFDALGKKASKAPLYFVLNKTEGDDVTVYLPEAEAALKRWTVGNVKRKYLSPFMRPDENGSPVKPVITSMDCDRFSLIAVSSELDPAELQKSHEASCVENLKSLLEKVRTQVSEDLKKSSALATNASQRVCDFLESKFVDNDGGLRSLCYDDAAKRLAESIQRTAPFAIRMAQAPGNFLKEMLGKLKKRNATDDDMARYAHVKAKEFAVFLMGTTFMPPNVMQENLEKVWNNATQAVKENAVDAFSDKKQLDAMTDKMWQEVPWSKKFALFGNIALAMIGFSIAAALAPIDGGASVVIWAKFNVILGGAEILGILVGGPMLGTILATSSAEKLVKKFEGEVACPQLNMLYAALCDGLGIPRNLNASQQLKAGKKVVHTFDQVSMTIQNSQIKLLEGPLIQIDESSWKEMIKSI